MTGAVRMPIHPSLPETEDPDTKPSLPGTEKPDGDAEQPGDLPSGETDKPSNGQGGESGDAGGNPGESIGQTGTEGIKGEPSKKASYVNNGGIKNQEGITSLIQGVNGNNNQETVKNDKSKLSEAGTKSSVQHISAEPEEKELVDQNKDLKTAEKVEKKQYPIGLAITLVIVGIAAAGYWCGKRVFKKK